MARSRKFAAALLLAGSLALGGCYGDKPTQTDEATDGLALLRADAKTSLQTATTKAGDTRSVTVDVEGTAAARTITSRGAINFGPPLAAELTVTGATSAPVTARILGTDAYVQIPPEFKAQTGGKNWLKADLADAARLLGADADELASQLQNADPAIHAKALLASGDLKVVGEEAVGSVRTVHYAGTTPVGSYLQNVDPDVRPAIERRLTKLGISEVKTDLWMDEQYQVRKAKVVLGSADLTLRFSDYGKPVEVVAPPAADTAELPRFLRTRPAN